MGVNSLPKTVTRQRHGCDLNPGPPALESSMLTTRLQNHPTIRCVTIIIIIYICASAAYSTSCDAALRHYVFALSVRLCVRATGSRQLTSRLLRKKIARVLCGLKKLRQHLTTKKLKATVSYSPRLVVKMSEIESGRLAGLICLTADER